MEATGSFWMKLFGREVVNGTQGPQVIFSWSFNTFNVCFVLLPGELSNFPFEARLHQFVGCDQCVATGSRTVSSNWLTS